MGKSAADASGIDTFKIGCNLYICRSKKGLTQAELAKQIGVTPKSISYWETGKRMITTEHLIKVGQVLEVTANDILYGNAEDVVFFITLSLHLPSIFDNPHFPPRFLYTASLPR